MQVLQREKNDTEIRMFNPKPIIHPPKIELRPEILYSTPKDSSFAVWVVVGAQVVKQQRSLTNEEVDEIKERVFRLGKTHSCISLFEATINAEHWLHSGLYYNSPSEFQLKMEDYERRLWQ